MGAAESGAASRATSMLFAVFRNGRRRTPRAATTAAKRARLRSSRPRSSTRHGVSSVSRDEDNMGKGGKRRPHQGMLYARGSSCLDAHGKLTPLRSQIQTAPNLPRFRVSSDLLTHKNTARNFDDSRKNADFVQNGCPSWDRTSDQVINSFLVWVFSTVCICPLVALLTCLFS